MDKMYVMMKSFKTIKKYKPVKTESTFKDLFGDTLPSTENIEDLFTESDLERAEKIMKECKSGKSKKFGR